MFFGHDGDLLNNRKL